MKAEAFPKAGLHHVSLSDFPGHVAALVFFTGCNFACPYCHNPELARGIVPENFLTFSEILGYLEERRGKLDGVVLTGGEPTLQPRLPEIVSLLHDLGYKVKIDTNGSNPGMLPSLDADFFALDIKTTLTSYAGLVSGSARDSASFAAAVRQSLDYIRGSGKPYEVRITCAPGFVNEKNIKEIAGYFQPHETVVLQRYRPDVVLDPSWEQTRVPYTEAEYASLLSVLHSAIPHASLR